MRKDLRNLYIVGASGFGKEVQWLIERINKENKTWNLLGYIDDGIKKGTEINGMQVLGNCEYLVTEHKEMNVVIAIGSAKIRKKVADRLINNPNISFPNLIDPSVICSDRIDWGKGNIVCASTCLTVNIAMGDFNIMNLDCTVGHDVFFGSFVTLYPSVNISGNVQIGDVTEIGTGANVIQGITIGGNSIIGAGSVVVKDIAEEGTYVGVPAISLLRK